MSTPTPSRPWRPTGRVPNKVVASMDEAVAGVPHGAVIMSGGFGPGTPYNLIAALARRGASDLTVISNHPGGLTPGDLSLLVENRQVRKAICSFTAHPRPSKRFPFEDQYERDEVEAELVPQGTLAERIRAGGAGIPAFYTPAGVGTVAAEGKEVREFDGRPCLLERALTADYALIRAWKADTFGNVVFRRSQRNFNPLMAMAARVTLVEVEEPVVEAGALDPDEVHLSGIFVDQVVQIPPDGVTGGPYNLAP